LKSKPLEHEGNVGISAKLSLLYGHSLVLQIERLFNKVFGRLFEVLNDLCDLGHLLSNEIRVSVEEVKYLKRSLGFRDT